jgi:exodeoxyribonuclease VII small subunit
MSDSFSYKSKKLQLDKILAELQSVDVDLDTSIKKYKKGLKLINEIENYLKKSKNTITEIKGKLES